MADVPKYFSPLPVKREGCVWVSDPDALLAKEPEILAFCNFINDESSHGRPTAKLQRALKWMEKQSLKGWAKTNRRKN